MTDVKTRFVQREDDNIKRIENISTNVHQTINFQSFNPQKKYKLIQYLKSLSVDDGVLLYNSFTKELLLLSYEEFHSINTNNSSDISLTLYKYLVEHWFFIPNEIDDDSIFYMFDKIYVNSHRLSSLGSLRNITILTTTECNARCYYCYEYQIKKRSMSNDMAFDVANYIKDHCENNVRLNWFGGEPLYNGKAIDIICKQLLQNNIKYFSTMTSNGYLFDQYDISSIKGLWNLKNVQITLDGINDIYNKTKNYIYRDTNPFKKVINNIRMLLNNDISVNIRLNLSLNNYNDLVQLINLLFEQFSSYNNISIYSSPLYENTGKNSSIYSQSEKEYLYNKNIAIDKLIRKYGFGKKLKIPNTVASHCMADNMHSVVITPEGNLTLCEHHIDDEFIGNIYDDKLNQSIIDHWKDREEIEDCKTCIYRPQCIKLKNCPAESRCSKEEIKYKEYLLEQTMEKTYDNYKKYTALKC